MLETSLGPGLARVVSRVRREATGRVPVVARAADGQHARRRRRHAPHLPVLSPDDRRIVEALETEAILVTHLDELTLPGTDELQRSLQPVVDALAARPRDGTTSTLRPSREELLADPSVWRWGLQDRLLDIVESYLGLPARYYGADVRREVADRKVVDVRQWHRDVEDRRTVKILLWLRDVAEDGGPYAYVPAAASAAAIKGLRYVTGFVSDDRLRRVVPDATWRTCPGPAGTVIVADNTRLLHRATPPVARDRYSVTFTWSSRWPVWTSPVTPFTPAQRAAIVDGLSPRQRACLPLHLQRPRRSAR